MGRYVTRLDELFEAFARQLAAARSPRRSGRDAAAGLLIVVVVAAAVAIADRGPGAPRAAATAHASAPTHAEPRRLAVQATPPR
jgi:hypothetical protein